MCITCSVRERWRLNAAAATHTCLPVCIYWRSHTSLYTPRPSLHPHPIFLVFFLEGDSNGEKEKQAAISSPVGCIAVPMLVYACHVCTRLWGSEELLPYRPQHEHASHRSVPSLNGNNVLPHTEHAKLTSFFCFFLITVYYTPPAYAHSTPTTPSHGGGTPPASCGTPPSGGHHHSSPSTPSSGYYHSPPSSNPRPPLTLTPPSITVPSPPYDPHSPPYTCTWVVHYSCLYDPSTNTIDFILVSGTGRITQLWYGDCLGGGDQLGVHSGWLMCPGLEQTRTCSRRFQTLVQMVSESSTGKAQLLCWTPWLTPSFLTQLHRWGTDLLEHLAQTRLQQLKQGSSS